MSRPVLDHEGERIDVGGIHLPGGGFVTLGDAHRVHILDTDNAHRLVVRLMVALAAALGEGGGRS